MTFSGVPTTALDFYEDLEADNSKAFWAAHKQIYEESVRTPLEAFAAAVAEEFGEAKLFRPYRDVRFSRDKTPYKTHQGVWFGQTSLYVEVSAAGLLVAGGYWRTSPAQVTRLRRSVGDDLLGTDLERIVGALTRAKLVLGGEQLTRVPSGYPKDHPRASLLRHKTLTAHRDLGAPAWLGTARAQNEIVRAWRAMTPLTAWLDRNVGRD